MSGYTNEEYVQILRVKNTRPFLDDVRTTLMEVREAIVRPHEEDETLRQYRRRQSIAMDELSRLLLRIQDGRTE